jgi:outer membrane protein assembly factor BamB
MKNIFLYFTAIIFFSCSKEDNIKDKNGIIITKNPLWSFTTTNDDSLANTFFLKKPVIYQNYILIQNRKYGGNILNMVDVSNGQSKWEWNDWIEKNIYSGNAYPYIQNNKLTWLSDYEDYQINLDNGKTNWKNSFRENYNHWCSGIGDIFLAEHLYNRGTAPEKGGGSVVVMSNLNGKPIEQFKPKYDTEKLSFDEYGWSYTAFGVPFTKNNETLVFVRFYDPPPTKPLIFPEQLSLFNLTKKEWIYERKKLKSKDDNWGTPHPSIIFNEKVYHGGTGVIICSDLMNGERIWETVLPKSNSSFDLAGILVANDKVYANSDGGQLMCLYANSGKLLWDIRSSGSSTALSYLNGVVYFVGGGDGKLHAVDAETGEYIWKIESPDIGKNKYAVFSGMCAVVPGVGSEKGKIVVTSGLNAYCYEAIR